MTVNLILMWSFKWTEKVLHSPFQNPLPKHQRL